MIFVIWNLCWISVVKDVCKSQLFVLTWVVFIAWRIAQIILSLLGRFSDFLSSLARGFSEILKIFNVLDIDFLIWKVSQRTVVFWRSHAERETIFFPRACGRKTNGICMIYNSVRPVGWKLSSCVKSTTFTCLEHTELMLDFIELCLSPLFSTGCLLIVFPELINFFCKSMKLQLWFSFGPVCIFVMLDHFCEAPVNLRFCSTYFSLYLG